MKTLVIHPSDPSTDMLKAIYGGKEWTVVDDNHIPKSQLKELIKEHDRIIMLGHGTSYGLVNGTKDRFLIDSTLVYLLRDKYCVCIWCNADEFVTRYELEGFYTGMIISEDIEANMFNVNATTDEIASSNTIFSEACRLAVEADAKDMVKIVTENYVGVGEVFDFNRARIYHTGIIEN
tara:strand:- start:3454 stop:3987 length:534 start_codon:yes stop_codon:yes gene_type:complete